MTRTMGVNMVGELTKSQEELFKLQDHLQAVSLTKYYEEKQKSSPHQ